MPPKLDLLVTHNSMTCRLLTAALLAIPALQVHADNLLWSDNYNVADSTSFDAASLDGRFSGFLSSDIVPRSAIAQHSIASQMLVFAGTGTARIRLQVPPAGASVVSYNFASGSAASEIPSGGGLRVEFDFQATNTSSTSGVCISTGFPSFNLVAEPTSGRVANAQTDFGILLANNGSSRVFKNGTSTTTSSYTATTGLRHVVINYGFSSYADGSPFTATVSVNGTQIINQSGTWSNNSGQFYLELGDAVSGTKIDNLQVFDKLPLRLGLALDKKAFKSDLATGSEIGTLSAMLGGAVDTATYQLVAGTGDTDNAKFQISGDKLKGGAYNFTGANSTEGQQFSVRVRGTSTSGGAQTDEKVLLLTVTKEDDSDGLPDAWEIAKAGNITSLNGNGTADFDADGLSDLEEYKLSTGTSENYALTLPNINPTLADSDGDGLKDREELEPGYQLNPNDRPPTNPTLADTDGDGLSDFAESATGTYVSATNTGTDPLKLDSDFDGLRDDFELAHLAQGYNPNVNDGALDTDGDGLNTTQEIAAGSNVLLSDTDGDGLSDGQEVNGSAGLRPATSPVRADTDYDGLSDFAETNTGTYVSASNTGTNPAKSDTDGDFARDGAEVAAGSDPLSASSIPPLPPGVTLGALTTNESSGISSAKTYSHDFSCGMSALFPGIILPPYTQTTPASIVPNVTWDSLKPDGSAADKQSLSADGQWVAATGNVTGSGLKELLRGYCYSNTGGAPGSKQVYTLSGLTPGKFYDLRLFHRSSLEPSTTSGRPIDLVFTNGSQVVTPFQTMPEDRPDIVLGGGSVHQAFYVSFRYRAQGSTLVIEAKVPLGGPANSGSYRFYGLTNEVLPLPPFAITAVNREPSGEVLIDFTGLPDTTYKLTKSPDLIAPFAPLAEPVTATTNSIGAGLVTVPAAQATETKAFYRIEE